MNEILGIPANTLLRILLIVTGLILLSVALVAWRYPLSFRLGLRNLPRRKSQTALVIGGLALSTMIITSALGIGDTIDYSTKAGVYERLGGIDIQLGTSSVDVGTGVSFSSGPSQDTSSANWFADAIVDKVALRVDGDTIDASVPTILQRLPVANSSTNLSEPAVEIRGIGEITGDGLATPRGLDSLERGQILVNGALALALDISVGDEVLVIKGMPTTFEVAGIVPDGELAGGSPALIMALEEAQEFFGQPNRVNAILVSNAGNAETGIEANAAAVERLAPVAATSGLVVSEVKARGLEAAEASAEFITTLFITFGTFSIFSGILLIFLIFSVLAAERQSELGISRAVGQQRTDLIRQFVTEGLAYDLVAAAVGAALGVGAALLLAGTITNLLASGSDLSITPRVSLRSVAIGYTLGLVITFLTVALSAVRISRVNIIAAIRNLNLPKPRRESQWTLFLHPLRVYRQMLREAGRRRFLKALKLFLLAGPRAIWAFWMGLLARGPILMGLGFLFAWVGVNVAEQAGIYGMGVALFLIGLGQFAAWIGLPERLAYSLTGLALILYWSLPTREVGRLAELGSNPGDFFISGLFMVGGAILLFLYNAEQLLVLFAGVLSRLGRLLPVARVSIAYPVAAKGRTATTLAMFSLIIFTLVGTATISNTFSNFLDVESGSGGYDVLVQTNPFNPIPADVFAEQVEELVAEGKLPPPAAIASVAFSPVEARSMDMEKPAAYAINGVDDEFLATNRLEFSGLATGFESAEQVWEALRADPTLVVIDSYSIDRAGDPTFQPDEDAFIVSSIRASDPTFDPVPLTITGLDGVDREYTVIGVLGSAPSFYGAMMSAEAAQSLGAETANGSLATNRYFVRLPVGSAPTTGVDARSAANSIESAFSRSGVQTSLPKQELETSRSSINSIFYLLQGFMALGLLIGIAALGVVTIRAVVERRQQIGVLRAIGFQREMVQAVFLLENMFVSGLGTFIGYALALTFAYNLYLQVAADQGLAFLPPWVTLAAIGFAVLAATLFTAWLHARQSAKVVIAEALRYQG
jgi:putative ABC transport system permease protein